MLTAVLDTNVLVSSTITPGGIPDRVVAEWTEGAYELVVSPGLLAELERALLSAKLRGRREDVDALLAELRDHAELVDDPTEIEPVVAADPTDDFIVALVRAAGAHLIVTGDRHLLEIEGLQPPAVTPRQLLVILLGHGR